MRTGRMVLKVDGKEDLMPFVRRLTYTEAIGELDGMTASLRIPLNFTKVNSLLEPGKPFKILVQDQGKTIVEREGDVVAVNFERDGRQYRVTLVGLNYLHRLRSEHLTNVWEDAHDKIVKTIAGRAKPSLSAKVEGVDTTPDFTFQQNESDAVFLMRLAREHNYYCRVVGKELHFGRRGTSSGSPLELDFKQNIDSVRLTANLKDHLNEVNVFWGDIEKDGTKLTKVTYKTAPKAMNSGGKLGCDVGKSAFGVKSVTLGGYDTPLYRTQSSAKAKAKAEMDVAALDFVEGVAMCTDVPKAMCGTMLKIKNATWPFDGSFLITKVFQEYIRNGLKTEITFKSNSLPKAP
ncbi:MAG: hypothetical protein CMK59_05220 [Proteobacteria bacterium]|nr:hypothetical protein [Pseudomonadota bacterium]